MADKSLLPKALTGGAALAAGLFAGCASTITLIDHPTWLELDKATRLQAWRACLNRAAQQPLTAVSAFVLSTAAAGTTAMTRRPRSLVVILPATGALAYGGIVAYTLLRIAPINIKLKDKATDEDEAEPLIAKWGKMNDLRTVVSTIGFAALITALVIWK